jgi:hypothetical protein
VQQIAVIQTKDFARQTANAIRGGDADPRVA